MIGRGNRLAEIARRNRGEIVASGLTRRDLMKLGLQVHPRRYRFRWLNVGSSRFYRFFLTELEKPRRVIPLTQISNDGNLLPRSVTVDSVPITVSERMDVVIDFSELAPGASIYLENRLEQEDGRGPTSRILAAGEGDRVLRFDVVLPPVSDHSLPPSYAFYKVHRPTPAELETARVRTWVFNRVSRQWSVNERFFDGETVRADPTEGTGEIWILQNAQAREPGARPWEHPIHIHFEEFQILSRNGMPPAAVEQGRKVVAINFMYARCEGTCPFVMSNLVQVQRILGVCGRHGRRGRVNGHTWGSLMNRPPERDSAMF